MNDPLAGSPWSAPATVAGFVASPPNLVLMSLAAAALTNAEHGLAVDIGCGAGRNAVPLAEAGWRVIGTDLSLPMLSAARDRVRQARMSSKVLLALAPMDALPVATASADLVVAHGIWNLATSDREFRAGVAEAARVAKPGALIFVFTFSRHTLPDTARPRPGETLVFTEFSGRPQCFVTEAELVALLDAVGCEREAGLPIREYNRPADRAVVAGPPVIYEAAFRKR